MTMEAGTLKETIRERIRGMRRTLDPARVCSASAIIAQKVLQRVEFTRASKVGCYLATPREVQMQRVIEACWAQGKEVSVPAHDPNRQAYGFAWYRQGEVTGVGPDKILQPLTIRPVAVSELEFIVVPAVAFDPAGRRLGHGGGHYDRLLKRCSGLKVGVVFEFQMVEAVPCAAHDVTVDLVVTEEREYRPRMHGKDLVDT